MGNNTMLRASLLHAMFQPLIGCVDVFKTVNANGFQMGNQFPDIR